MKEMIYKTLVYATTRERTESGNAALLLLRLRQHFNFRKMFNELELNICHVW